MAVKIFNSQRFSKFLGFLQRLDFRKFRFWFISFTLVLSVYIFKNNFWWAFLVAFLLLFLAYIDVFKFMNLVSAFYIAFSGFLCFLSLFLFFNYYPNISLFLRLGAFVFYSVILYTLILLNNIVLFVVSRGEAIPIYRVATNWVQFVLLSLGIPLFTGLLKLDIQPLLQVLIVGLFCIFLYFYFFWVWGGERDIKKPSIWEKVVLAGGFALICVHAVFVTLFFAAESFLRGLFASSVFLFGLGYIYLYIRNSLDTKALRYYLINLAVFFIIMILFKP